MVFKTDFVEDLGGPKEVAAVDPKMAYYLADSLRAKNAAVGNVIKAGVEGYINVDSAYKTAQLSENMLATTQELETGMKKDTAIQSVTNDYNQQVAAAKAANPSLSPDEQDKMTNDFKDKLQTIEAAFNQKGISYGEAVFRWNRALQQAIAARPSLAQEFRQISGRWTGSTDWDHYYIKQEAAAFDAQKQAQADMAKKMEQRAYDEQQKNISWYSSKLGVPPETAQKLLADPNGQKFVATQVALSMQTQAAKAQAEQLKANGELDSAKLRPAFNTMLAQSTYNLVARHSLALTTLDSGPMAKYNKGGEGGFDYTAASKDANALEWLRNSIIQDIAKEKTAQATTVAGLVRGTSVDPSQFYKESDDWEKRLKDVLDASPTAALNMIKVMRDGKTKDFNEAIAVVGAMNNAYRNLGVNGTSFEEYTRLGPEAYTKLHGKASADMMARYSSLNTQSMGMTQDYAANFGLTLKQIGDGSLPDKPVGEMTQAEADARIAATDNILTALNNGSVDPQDQKVYNTVKTMVQNAAPVGVNWDGENGLLKSINNGNFVRFLSSVSPEQASEIKTTVQNRFTSWLKSFDKSATGRAVLTKALGGTDYDKKYVVTPIISASGLDEYGIGVPKYKVTLTPEGRKALRFEGLSPVLTEGRMTDAQADAIAKAKEDTLNRDMARAFMNPYNSAIHAMSVLGKAVPTVAPKGTPKEVPKNTPSANEATSYDW